MHGASRRNVQHSALIQSQRQHKKAHSEPADSKATLKLGWVPPSEGHNTAATERQTMPVASRSHRNFTSPGQQRIYSHASIIAMMGQGKQDKDLCGGGGGGGERGYLRFAWWPAMSAMVGSARNLAMSQPFRTLCITRLSQNSCSRRHRDQYRSMQIHVTECAVTAWPPRIHARAN